MGSHQGVSSLTYCQSNLHSSAEQKIIVRFTLGFVAAMALIYLSSAFQLDKQASWSKAVQNYFDENGQYFGYQEDASPRQQAEERTLDIELMKEADWTTAWTKNLSNQALYNNCVKCINENHRMDSNIIGFVTTMALISLSSAFQLDSQASWSKAVQNYFDENGQYFGYQQEASPRQAEDRTLDIELKKEADWTTAWTKNLSNQALYNNCVKEIFNALTRIIGWTAMSLALYGFTFTL